MDGLILAAVNAEHIAPDALSLADCIIAFGEPASVLERYAEAIGEPTPSTQPGSLDVGQAVLWRRSTGQADQMQAIRGDTQRRSHIRRWSEAPLIDSKAFRFRGPDQRLNLAASTLSGFLDIAGGVDDATWQHHLLQGDYSSWLRDAIHYDDLATAVADIEAKRLDPDDSRARIAAVFHDWYRS